MPRYISSKIHQSNLLLLDT